MRSPTTSNRRPAVRVAWRPVRLASRPVRRALRAVDEAELRVVRADDLVLDALRLAAFRFLVAAALLAEA
jgi:hypothetical protein